MNYLHHRYNHSSQYRDTADEQFQQSLQLITEAVQGEREDQLFYEFLISEAPTEEEREIIASIRDDEIKHNRLFRQLYQELTGQEVPSGNGEEFSRPDNYVDGLKQALFGELRAVEKYRTIRQGLPTEQQRDVLFEIITDELKHASKYNYLYTFNRTEPIYNEEYRQPTEETEMSVADQWVQHIEPLVNFALQEVEQGINLTHLFQEYILAGVLVGQGFTPAEAIAQVEEWEKTGESKLLQESKQMTDS